MFGGRAYLSKKEGKSWPSLTYVRGKERRDRRRGVIEKGRLSLSLPAEASRGEERPRREKKGEPIGWEAEA